MRSSSSWREKYTFVLADLDTSFRGSHPGNGGSIKITVRY